MTRLKKVVAIAAVAAVAVVTMLLVWHFQSKPSPPQDTKADAKASETTAPLAAPLPVPPASAPALPATNNCQWGPVKEVTLSSDAAGTNYLLDLDTGRVLTPAQEMRPERLVSPAHGFPTRQSTERIWLGYLYGLGVDIVNEQNLVGLATCDLVLDSAGGADKWDSLSAADMVRAAERFRKLPGPFDRGTFCSADRKVPPPITMLFRTREGGLGILQVTEIQYQPKTVTIRFKLVEEIGQSAPSTASGVQNPSGQ